MKLLNKNNKLLNIWASRLFKWIRYFIIFIIILMAIKIWFWGSAEQDFSKFLDSVEVKKMSNFDDKIEFGNKKITVEDFEKEALYRIEKIKGINIDKGNYVWKLYVESIRNNITTSSTTDVLIKPNIKILKDKLENLLKKNHITFFDINFEQEWSFPSVLNDPVFFLVLKPFKKIVDWVSYPFGGVLYSSVVYILLLSLVCKLFWYIFFSKELLVDNLSLREEENGNINSLPDLRTMMESSENTMTEEDIKNQIKIQKTMIFSSIKRTVVNTMAFGVSLWIVRHYLFADISSCKLGETMSKWYIALFYFIFSFAFVLFQQIVESVKKNRNKIEVESKPMLFFKENLLNKKKQLVKKNFSIFNWEFLLKICVMFGWKLLICLLISGYMHNIEHIYGRFLFMIFWEFPTIEFVDFLIVYGRWILG